MNNYSTWYPVERMMQEVEHFLSDFAPVSRQLVKSGAPLIHPACEIEEGKDYFFISIDVPGIKPGDIQIECVENRLLVSGERKAKTKIAEGGHRVSERSYGSFKRSFHLPESVSIEEAEAHYEDGTLKLFLPKTKKHEAKQIKISSKAKSQLFGKLLDQTDHASS